MKANLPSVGIHSIVSIAKVVLLLDLREHSATNTDHPQEFVDVITRIPTHRDQNFKVEMKDACHKRRAMMTPAEPFFLQAAS